MKQRQVFRGVGALVGVLMLSGCGLDIGKLDYTEPEFVGSYVGDGAATVVALGEDRTFTAVGVPDEVLDNVAGGAVDEAPAEIEGTWKYDSKSSADHVELTVTDADGMPAKLGELPLYVADADDLFFLPDQLGREKIVVSRSRSRSR
ncbi:hypothetical protein [Promicromonospora iranensis]|uniref:Uncharacterized protein n=1 Tax=Promicromonospora iranensis TaxID=1105144 RepID=A0ABU2CRI7_9MICO|nr:hypothetical protein [Promicromonospora iranensis]MDR7383945.1 hypothetical protein [Promicromonospora iranensis]